MQVVKFNACPILQRLCNRKLWLKSCNVGYTLISTTLESYFTIVEFCKIDISDYCWTGDQCDQIARLFAQYLAIYIIIKNFLITKTIWLGSCCCSVGRVVASNSRGPRFESSHRQINIYKYENKEKEAEIGPFKK